MIKTEKENIVPKKTYRIKSCNKNHEDNKLVLKEFEESKLSRKLLNIPTESDVILRD